MRDYKEMQRRNGNGLMESIEVRQIINQLETAEANLKAVKAECQGWRDDYAPDNVPSPENELLEAIEQIVGRDMS
jgi:hypothetical protein